MYRKKIAEQLLDAQVAIDNALGSEGVLAELGRFGYDQAALQGGRALYEEAVRMANRQRAAYGKQHQATVTFRAARREAHRVYRRALWFARLVMRSNKEACTALALNGRREHAFPAWVDQVVAFYDNLAANEDLLARMTGLGYDGARLAQERALVQAAVEANAAQEDRKVEAREATARRDEALAALEAWMDGYRAVACAALVERPHWLDVLGFGAVP
jgi:hypothetical protein